MIVERWALIRPPENQVAAVCRRRQEAEQEPEQRKLDDGRGRRRTMWPPPGLSPRSVTGFACCVANQPLGTSKGLPSQTARASIYRTLSHLFVPPGDCVVVLLQVPVATWDNTSASLTTEASTTSATTTACARKVREGGGPASGCATMLGIWVWNQIFLCFCSSNCSIATLNVTFLI